MNFVLDFQDLTVETTQKYIEKMINEMKIENEYFPIIQKLLITSHFFIKEKSDVSSVSLREINRFVNIYKFFLGYLEKRNKNDENLNLSKKKIKEDSIILSLYFCYYLKLPTSKLRIEYLTLIKSKANFNYIEIFERESNFIADKVINGQKGYAKNKALKENLFCEFVCLRNREPLIICGKPGASKSLSIRLLINAMKGNLSPNEYFKSYEEIIPSFYQCSLTSTSKGVQNVFIRAKNRLKEYKNSNINSLVLMDEMGIADESKK